MDTSDVAPVNEVLKVTLSYCEKESGTRSLKVLLLSKPLNLTRRRVAPAVLCHHTQACNEQVDLTSEINVFFYYFDDCDEDEFNKRRLEQKLTLDYNQYAAVLTQLFNSCITEPQTHLAVLILEDDGMRGRLDFIKVMHCSRLLCSSLHCKHPASTNNLAASDSHLASMRHAFKSLLQATYAWVSVIWRPAYLGCDPACFTIQTRVTNAAFRVDSDCRKWSILV